MKSTVSNEVQALYQQLIDGWNNRSARAMADQFAEDGEMIGFDGSQAIGREEIFSHLDPIFKEHPTPPFVTKVKNVRFLDSDAAILRAIAGMVPPGQSEIDPKLNTHHTLVAVKKDGKWKSRSFKILLLSFMADPS